MKKTSVLQALAIVALSAVQHCAAAATDFQEQAYRYKGCDEKFGVTRVPVFADRAGGAGTMIDKYIGMAVLSTAPPLKRDAAALPVVKGSFLDIGVDKLQARVADILGGRVVEVSFAWHKCGLPASTAAMVRRFDAGTGRLITERDLFTPDGKAVLQRLLYRQRRQRLVDEVQRQERRRAEARNKQDRQHAERTKVLYAFCLEGRFGPAEWREEEAVLGMAAISERQVTFEYMPCSTSQADDAIDVLGRFATQFELRDIKSYLSAYGRYVFFGEGDGRIPVDATSAQFFHGKIGGAPVTLYLEAAYSGGHAGGVPKFATGSYFYDKYRSVIPLTVSTQDAKNYIFEERDAEFRPTGTFEVAIDRPGLAGTWRSNSKRLPVEATRE